MSDGGLEELNAKLAELVKKKLEEAKRQEDRFNTLMDEIFKLNPELVLMKLDIAFRLHRATILIGAEIAGQEDEARKAVAEVSKAVDKIMEGHEKLIRDGLMKEKGKTEAKKNDGSPRTVDPGTGYT